MVHGVKVLVNDKTATKPRHAARAVMESYLGGMPKVVITGPESSGKTTLAMDLSAHFDVPWVPEQARPYLEARQGLYGEADLLQIAQAQVAAEDLHGDTDLLICDTDLITIRIWGEEKYGRSDPWIVRATEERTYDHWLLCSPDMAWEPDPLRENPHDRERLFEVYRDLLTRLGRPFTIISGDPDERLRAAVTAVMRL